MRRKTIPAMLLAALLTVLLLGAVGTERVYACSCMEFGSYSEALESSSHVLDATVTGKHEIDSQQIVVEQIEVDLSVAASWKGEASPSMKAVTALHSASCGYGFEVGKRYAIFAYENKEDQLSVSLCSATTPLEDGDAIFDELGEPTPLEQNGDDDDPVTETPAPTLTSSEVDDELSPDQIKLQVTEEELEQRMETRKSQLLIVFGVVGGLLIVGAVALLLMRRRR